MRPQQQVRHIHRSPVSAFQHQQGKATAQTQRPQLFPWQLIPGGIAELHGLTCVAKAARQTENAVLLQWRQPQIPCGHQRTGFGKIEAAQNIAGTVVTFQKGRNLLLLSGTMCDESQRDAPFGGQHEGSPQTETGVDLVPDPVLPLENRRFQCMGRTDASSTSQKSGAVGLHLKRLEGHVGTQMMPQADGRFIVPCGTAKSRNTGLPHFFRMEENVLIHFILLRRIERRFQIAGNFQRPVCVFLIFQG